MLPPRMTGPRPQAGQRTRPRTSTAPKGAESVWRRAPTRIASLPARHRGPPHPPGGGIWTTRARKATHATPAATRNRRRPETWAYGSTGSPEGEQLALAVSIRWHLTLPSCHPEEGTRTRADITFGHRAGHTHPTTMDHPCKWHYVANRLMAHMGAYSPDGMNGLHWQWHQRAPLRIRTAMQRYNICTVPGSPGYRGHASGHRRPRSQVVPEPPIQAARRNSPGHHQGPLPGVGSPSGTYRSPLQPFAPQRDQGSPHTLGVQGGKPERHQETRNPGRSWRRSRMRPPAARRFVFYEGVDRGHGGPNHPNAQRTSSATDPRRRSKRPRTERAHIPTIPTPAEGAPQAALHTDSDQATDRASSWSAASLPGSAACPLPGGQHATDTRPRGPAADQRPEQGVGDKPLNAPHREAGAMTPVPDTGTGHATNWARTPRGSPPELQHSQTAGARKTRSDNGSTTRAAQERTKK